MKRESNVEKYPNALFGEIWKHFGFFGLLVGISGKDLKAKDAPMLLLLAILWPYVVYLWFKDHYFEKG